MTTPFNWNGTSNLLIEICYNNSSWSTNSTVLATASTGKVWCEVQDLTTGDGCVDLTAGVTQSNRPNLCFTIGLVGTNNLTTTVPAEYSLSQNYPNPFNPVTQIKYAIPEKGFVTMKVFDVLGREVSKLVNNVQSAGNYIVDFDGTNLASGIYFYKLR